MNKAELKEAVAIAQSDADLSAEAEQCNIFDGCALPDFKPVTVTVRQVAELIRWQAILLNGQIDTEALNELANWGRKRFLVVG